MDKIGIHFDISLNQERVVDRGIDTSADRKKKFKEVIIELLTLIIDPDLGKINLGNFEVYVNRSPSSPFFLIGATEEQQRAFEESKTNPPHEPLTKADLKLSTEKIIEKYKIAAFTLYKTKQTDFLL